MLPRQRDVVPQGHLFRCAPLQDAVPYRVCSHAKEPLRWERLSFLSLLLQCGGDEAAEQGVGAVGAALELRVELAAHVPRVVRQLHHLH